MKSGKSSNPGNDCIDCSVSPHINRLFRKESQVVIYSNADDEAIEAMKHALTAMDLKENTFSSPLGPGPGGKLLAEGPT